MLRESDRADAHLVAAFGRPGHQSRPACFAAARVNRSRVILAQLDVIASIWSRIVRMLSRAATSMEEAERATLVRSFTRISASFAALAYSACASNVKPWL